MRTNYIIALVVLLVVLVGVARWNISSQTSGVVTPPTLVPVIDSPSIPTTPLVPLAPTIDDLCAIDGTVSEACQDKVWSDEGCTTPFRSDRFGSLSREHLIRAIKTATLSPDWQYTCFNKGVPVGPQPQKQPTEVLGFGTTANIATDVSAVGPSPSPTPSPMTCESQPGYLKNVGEACYNQIWRAAGCTTGANYADWHTLQTKDKLIQDANTWATTPDNTHRQRCYGTSCGKFDKAGYLKLWPDVAAAKLDAWTHYKNYGYNENRKIMLSNGVSGIFDRTAYLKMYPSIGMDPWTHYVTIGYNTQQNICVV